LWDSGSGIEDDDSDSREGDDKKKLSDGWNSRILLL
jgi:hypothetical protein